MVDTITVFNRNRLQLAEAVFRRFPKNQSKVKLKQSEQKGFTKKIFDDSDENIHFQIVSFFTETRTDRPLERYFKKYILNSMYI